MLDAAIVETDSAAENARDARVANVIKRAKNGEEITIAYLGGSITYGYNANNLSEDAYAPLTQNWWNSNFPDATINYVNLGIPGTPSDLGLYRMNYYESLPDSKKPDLVIIDFTANDYYSTQNYYKNSYNGLVKNILSYNNNPAVVLLFVAKDNYSICGGDTTSSSFMASDQCEDQVHKPIGTQYNVPMISYKNCLDAIFEPNSIVWDEIVSSSDHTHPTNSGHKLLSQTLTNYFQNVLDKVNNDEISTNPEDLQMTNAALSISNIYSNAKLYNCSSDNIDVSGFTVQDNTDHDFYLPCWKSNSTGTSTIKFNNISGKKFDLFYYNSERFPANGTFTVTIDPDSENPRTLDPIQLNTYNYDFTNVVNILNQTDCSTHTILVTSNCSNLNIIGLGVSGQ